MQKGVLIEVDIADLIFSSPFALGNFDENKLFMAGTTKKNAAEWLFMRELDRQSHMAGLLKEQSAAIELMQESTFAEMFELNSSRFATCCLELKQFVFFVARVKWLGNKHLVQLQEEYKVFKGVLIFT